MPLIINKVLLSRVSAARTSLDGVLRGEEDAILEREPREEEHGDAVLLQPRVQPRRQDPAVVLERRVRVELSERKGR